MARTQVDFSAILRQKRVEKIFLIAGRDRRMLLKERLVSV
jgi:hypothetical protein